MKVAPLIDFAMEQPASDLASKPFMIVSDP
jgi:hypothetical protein